MKNKAQILLIALGIVILLGAPLSCGALNVQFPSADPHIHTTTWNDALMLDHWLIALGGIALILIGSFQIMDKNL